jgi:hypothetical protein
LSKGVTREEDLARQEETGIDLNILSNINIHRL